MKKFVYYILILLIPFLNASTKLFAENDLYKGYNYNGAWGTSFYFTIPPPAEEESSSADKLIKIIVVSRAKTSVTVRGKNDFFLRKEVEPMKPEEFVFFPENVQPYIKNARDPIVRNQLYSNAAVRITSTEPITAYVIVDYTRSGDGFFAIPVSNLGKNYIISSYTDGSAIYPGYYSFPSIAGIVAPFNNTNITAVLGGNSKSGYIDEARPGDTIRQTMNAGEVWMLTSWKAGSDLTGTKIISDKPISVLSGNQCAAIPTDNLWCDYIVEMETPDMAWGKEYLVPIVPGKKYSPVLRAYAKVPGTKIYINGEEKYTIETNGGLEGKGFVEFRLNDYDGATPGVVTADNPINLMMYNTGSQEDGDPKPLGEPFAMNLMATENTVNDFVFYMPEPKSNYSNSRHYLSLAIECPPDGFINDTLEQYTAGAFSGHILLNPSEAKTKHYVNSNGKTYCMLNYIIPHGGVYRLKSATRAAGYMFVLTNQDSYGMPAYMRVRDKEKGDSLPPVPTYEMQCNGDVLGWVEDMPSDEKRCSNLSLIVFLSDLSNNYKMSSGDIISGVTQKAYWKLSIRDPYNDAYAAIEFHDHAGNDTTIEIAYFAPKIQVIPDKFDFGVVKKGTTPETTVKIKNIGKTEITLSKASMLKYGSQFKVLTNLTNVRLKPNESTNCTIRFDANKDGVFKDSLGVADTCSTFYLAEFIAECASPEIWVDDISLTEVTKNTQKDFVQFIRNTGKANLDISGFSNSVNPEITVDPQFDFSTGKTLVIKPGESHQFKVTFAPTTEKEFIENIVFFSNASKSDSICKIKLKCVAPGLSTSSFNWGKKRVIKPGDTPYALPNGISGLTVENNGSTAAKINSITVTGTNQSKVALVIDEQSLIGKTIQPGSKLTLPIVSFAPIASGDYEIIIDIKYNNSFSAKSYITGIGVIPKISVNNIEFDTLQLASRPMPSRRTIVVKNLSVQDWAFADTLRLKGFVSKVPNEIGFDSYGEKYFSVYSGDAQFPVTILPGNEYSFTTEFNAQEAGDYKSQLLICSDAETDTASITLHGVAVNQSVEGTCTTAECCVGEAQTLTLNVHNLSSETMVLKQLLIDPAKGEFSIANANDAGEITLAAKEMRSINIIFKPISAGTKTGVIYIIGINGSLFDSVRISAKANLSRREISLNPITQTLDYGTSANVKIILNDGDLLNSVGIKDFKLRLTYSENYLMPITESIEIGSALSGKFEIASINQIADNIFEIALHSVAGLPLDGYGEILRLAFKTYFGAEDKSEAIITPEFITEGTDKCIDFSNASALVRFNPICVEEVRKIIFSSTNYYIKEISYNSSNEILLEAGVGIKAHTELSVYGADGSLVSMPINKVMESGVYNVHIPTKDLSTGIYFYKFTSGPYEYNGKLILVK